MDLELKITRLFKKMEDNPTDLKYDASFISLMDCMGNLLDKYKDMK